MGTADGSGTGWSPREVRSGYLCRFVERKTRQPVEKILVRIAVADVDQEVRLDLGAGEELRVHAGLVETGHRAAIEAECAGCHDQVGALKRAIAGTGSLDQRLVADEPAAGIGMRKQLGQVLVEREVRCDDGGD